MNCLLINLDDKFEATFFKSSSASNPNKRIFKVVGIYSSGLTEFDEVYFFGDIRHVQKMNKWTKDEFGNIEIFLKVLMKDQKNIYQRIKHGKLRRIIYKSHFKRPF